MRESSEFFMQTIQTDGTYAVVGCAEGGARLAGAEAAKVLNVCGRNGETEPVCSKRDGYRRRTRQNGLRRLSQRMKCASAIAGMAEAALRFFHLRPHGVQVVGGRNHGKQQNQRAAENANEDEGTMGSSRRSPLPPQQKGGHQQREPTEIEKKLHTKCRGAGTNTMPQRGATASRRIRIAQRRGVIRAPVGTKSAMDLA